MRGIIVATEDILSEAVAEKLIQETGGQLQVVQKLGRQGFGYLRSRMLKFNQMARTQPVFVLTDLDRVECATTLIENWMGQRRLAPGLLFRVAVREIESWLLADHEAMRRLLGRTQLRLPDAPDALADPKETLVRLARKGPRAVREAIIPEPGAVASQGLGYNNILVDHVRNHWSPERAASRSDSLSRARIRILKHAALAS